MRKKSELDPIRIAERLIDRHGLRAAAVAAEHANEAQLARDAAALHRWSQVRSAIGEVRAVARHAAEASRRS